MQRIPFRLERQMGGTGEAVHHLMIVDPPRDLPKIAALVANLPDVRAEFFKTEQFFHGYIPSGQAPIMKDAAARR